MKNIKDAFSRGKAFIPFITCGDPDLDTTKEIILSMQKAGADLIELGIPFSDPTAEGVVIQNANTRSLKGGTTTDKIFNMVSEIKEEINIPLVFMTYANVVFSYGLERFLSKAKKCGICGLILPDVPFEEKKEFSLKCHEYKIELVSLVAPTSEDRICKIAKDAEGFIYCVSSLGVTGVRSSITTDIGAMTRLVKESCDIPCAVGFGISTPEQASDMVKYADGVIVGSAIVKIIEKYGAESADVVYKYVKSMKEAIS